MSTKKKQPVKTQDASKPKYKLGQTVYFADYSAKPKIRAGKVISIESSSQLPPAEQNGHKAEAYTNHCYSLQTSKGLFDQYQHHVYPSFQQAAVEYCKNIFEGL